MTTAARPTFHPAVGLENQGYFQMTNGSRQLSAKDMPGHTRLKMRRQEKSKSVTELREELLKRELDNKEKSKMLGAPGSSVTSEAPPLVITDAQDADDLVTADMDSSDDDDDDEDETIELMKELERIKREREEDAAKKMAKDKARDEEERQDAMLRGNPLMGGAFGVKRRWDDDVVFRNQAREDAPVKKQFINDTIRNDFHRKFLHKYVQ